MIFNVDEMVWEEFLRNQLEILRLIENQANIRPAPFKSYLESQDGY